MQQAEVTDEDSKASENGDAKLKENGEKGEEDSKDGENGDSTGMWMVLCCYDDDESNMVF